MVWYITWRDRSWLYCLCITFEQPRGQTIYCLPYGNECVYDQSRNYASGRTNEKNVMEGFVYFNGS